METIKEQHYIGCCGLYCGLCPRFTSSAPSRCTGCQLGPQHDYCSVYRCCAKGHGLGTCAECDEYPCERLLRALGAEEGLDSFVSHKPALPNLDRIREVGLDAFLKEQKERRLLAEHLIASYNEGRSMSFYCRACALLPPDLVREAIGVVDGMLADGLIDDSEMKAKAKTTRSLIQRRAAAAAIDLRLRKKKR